MTWGGSIKSYVCLIIIRVLKVIILGHIEVIDIGTAVRRFSLDRYRGINKADRLSG